VNTPTSQPEEYDLLVLGSGEAGKYIAWTLARQHSIVANCQHRHICIGSGSSSRYTGRQKIELVETERLRVTGESGSHVPNEHLGAASANIVIKYDANF
jgi:hypothetical protein